MIALRSFLCVQAYRVKGNQNEVECPNSLKSRHELLTKRPKPKCYAILRATETGPILTRKSQHFWFRISNVWMSFFRLVWNDIFLSWSFLKNSLNPLTECWHRKINTYFDYLWIAYIANLKKKRFGVRCYSETESFNRNQRPGLIWKTIWFEALSFRRTIKSFSRWSS